VRLLRVACVLMVLGLSAWIGFRTWPRRLEISLKPLPSVRFESGAMVVPLPTEALLGEVGEFDNELSAYLWFDYLRSRPSMNRSQVLLVVKEEGMRTYRIQIILPNDALTAVPFLAQLEANGYIQCCDLAFSHHAPVEYSRKQTEVFIARYKRPVYIYSCESTTRQLLVRTARFLAFKSWTGPRVQAASGSEIAALGQQEATDLAADIIAVAKFYDLPLDLFLGIGTMEKLSEHSWRSDPLNMEKEGRQGRHHPEKEKAPGSGQQLFGGSVADHTRDASLRSRPLPKRQRSATTNMLPTPSSPV
jgi:hypothetical protein